MGEQKKSRKGRSARGGAGAMKEREPSAAEGLTPPRTPEELHGVVRDVLGVNVSRRAMVERHAAPFDYLVHAFFEGAVSAEGTARSERPPLDSVVWASRGGGKTFLGALATLLDLLFKPGIEVRILGGSLEQSQRMNEHLRRFCEMEAIAPHVAKFTDRSLKMANGSRAMVMTHSQASVRGTRVQKIRCDEVELFDPGVWQAVQLTTRSMDCPGPWGPVVRGAVEAFSTMHRPMGLMADLVESASHRPAAGADEAGGEGASAVPSRTLFRWGVLDVLEKCGPEHLCESCALQAGCRGRAKQEVHEPGHVRVADALAQRARVNRAVWEAEMLSLRPSRGGTVLPEFEIATHVYGRAIDEPGGAPCPEGKWVAGMDFGYRAPTVILWAHLGVDDVLRVEREYAERERTMDEHIAVLADTSRPRPAFIAVDPAGAQANDQTARTNVQLLGDAGFSVKHRPSAIVEGLMGIRRRLEGAAPTPGEPAPAPRLMIHARCKRLITALQRYHYPEDQPESETPVKDGHDHFVDALRYLVLNLDTPWKSRCSVRG